MEEGKQSGNKPLLFYMGENDYLKIENSQSDQAVALFLGKSYFRPSS